MFFDNDDYDKHAAHGNTGQIQENRQPQIIRLDFSGQK